MKHFIFIPIVLALAAAGCAGVEANRQSHAAPVALPGKEACLFSVNITSWEVLDDQTLLVQAPLSRDTYLLKLFAPITGLRFHETLGFEDGDHNGQLCSTGDALLVRGTLPQSMPISAVRLLSKAEADQLRLAYKR